MWIFLDIFMTQQLIFEWSSRSRVCFMVSLSSIPIKSSMIKSLWPPASVNWSSRVLDRSARKPRCQKARCYVKTMTNDMGADFNARMDVRSIPEKSGWFSQGDPLLMVNRKKGGRLYRFTGPGVKYKLYAFIFLSTQKQGTIIVFSFFSSINYMHYMYVGVNGGGWKLSILLYIECF